MTPPRARRRAATSRGALLGLRNVVAALVAVSSVVALAACEPSEPEDLIHRDTFVDAYVELRIAALDTDSQRVAASDRDSILDRIGITGDDLLRFVEFHGGDLEFMRDVWNDVELRLDRPPEPTPAEEADGSEEPEGPEGSGEPAGSAGSNEPADGPDEPSGGSRDSSEGSTDPA